MSNGQILVLVLIGWPLAALSLAALLGFVIDRMGRGKPRRGEHLRLIR